MNQSQIKRFCSFEGGCVKSKTHPLFLCVCNFHAILFIIVWSMVIMVEFGILRRFINVCSGETELCVAFASLAHNIFRLKAMAKMAKTI